jgi:hypothetical protein
MPIRRPNQTDPNRTDPNRADPNLGRTAPPETAADTPADRRRRRARLLAEIAEARALRARVTPRRTRNARLRQALLMRTFRW